MIAVDGHLLGAARAGNREAIRQVAEIAVDHLRQQVAARAGEIDDITPYLIQVLARIAAGGTPNAAFAWDRRGRQPENLAFLHWSLALHVEALIKDGFLKEDALDLVGEAAKLSGDTGGTVYKAFSEYLNRRQKGDEFPEDLFPISPATYQQVKEIDRRMAELVAERRSR